MLTRFCPPILPHETPTGIDTKLYRFGDLDSSNELFVVVGVQVCSSREHRQSPWHSQLPENLAVEQMSWHAGRAQGFLAEDVDIAKPSSSTFLVSTFLRSRLILTIFWEVGNNLARNLSISILDGAALTYKIDLVFLKPKEKTRLWKHPFESKLSC